MRYNNKYSVPIYFGSIFLIYVLYILAYFKLYAIDQFYIELLVLFVNIFICFVLMINYNPFVKPQFSNNDGTFIFGCAIFLLSNTITNNNLLKPFYMKLIETRDNFLKHSD